MVMSQIKELKTLVGQLFMVGFDGISVPQSFKDAIREYKLGGTIYFKRNAESPAQLAELSNELQFDCRENTSPFMFIAIDHEGGKVNRLSKPFTQFPGNEYLGEINSPKMGFQFGAIMAKELKAVGININFAPVVDVNTNPDNPVMKDRMFSSDPEICGKLGSAVCRGIQKMGVAAVAKHFPGHGDTKVDSHFDLPRIDRSLSELDKIELIPFKRMVRSRVEGVMTAHIINSALDPDYPATLSEKTIQPILRQGMRYSKLIFSDDMEMKAITDHYGIDEAAVLAVKAGCDVLIYRGDQGVPESAIEAVIKAVESKQINRAQLEASVERILNCKKSYAVQTSPIEVTEVGKMVGIPEHIKLAEMIANKEKLPESDSGDNDF
ncbi:MAG: beta-N-acetylhexosaminidase [Proteobacteria bacterium]|nr:beta-N-acetylhexosaminidase [Pseudomonadota bacterium]NBY20458.1 beta-N-acetylhexosaminidase [bacterium]